MRKFDPPLVINRRKKFADANKGLCEGRHDVA